jgi:hypothetical protein
MKTLLPALAAASLALAATFTFAQGTPGHGPGMGDQARRGEMREQMKGAFEACKDKPDRRACMTETMCAKSPDPAKCQAQARERHAKFSQRMDERQKAHEACTGKRGEELGKCLGEQRQKSGDRWHSPRG